MIRKHFWVITLCFLCFGIMVVAVSGCQLKQDLPDVVSIQDRFEYNKENITLVTEYLLDLSYPDAWIREPNGTYFSDFEWRTIEDERVCEAIETLWENGISNIDKTAEDNSISFEMWRSFQEIDCGVAFSIDNTDCPTVQYMTYVEPLTERGWYYYVSDYNQWRVEHPPEN